MSSNKDSTLKAAAKALFLVWLFTVLFSVLFVVVGYPLKFMFHFTLVPLGISPVILTWTSGTIGVVCAGGVAFLLCRKIWLGWKPNSEASNTDA